MSNSPFVVGFRVSLNKGVHGSNAALGVFGINQKKIEQHNRFRILSFLFSSSAIKAVTNVHNTRFERQASVT